MTGKLKMKGKKGKSKIMEIWWFIYVRRQGIWPEKIGPYKGNHRVVWSNKAISLSRYLILRGKKKPSFRCKKRRKWRISSPTIRSPSLKKPSACSTRTATVWFSLFIISLLLALDFLIDLLFSLYSRSCWFLERFWSITALISHIFYWFSMCDVILLIL